MALARDYMEWERISQVLYFAYESNRDAKENPTPYRVDDFHPYRRTKPVGSSVIKVDAKHAFEFLMGSAKGS